MKRPDRITLVACAVALLLGLAAMLADRGGDAGATGPSYALDDVRAGGFAALGEVLRREGVTVRRWQLRTVELDATVPELFSAPSQRATPGGRGEAEDDALVAWVRRGGYFVHAGAAGPAGLHLPGGRLVRSPADRALTGTLRERVGATTEWNYRFHARRNDRVLLGDARGAVALSYRLGAGTVVALAGADPFTNAAIARAGNARLATALALDRTTHPVVVFDEAVHGDVRDRPWWQALGIPLRLTLAIAAVAIAAGIAGGALRMGPPLPPPAAPQPTSAAFIAALAALHRRAGTDAHAAHVLAQDATRRAARALALDESLDIAQLARRVPPEHRLAPALAALAGAVRAGTNLLAIARAAWTLRMEVGPEHGG